MGKMILWLEAGLPASNPAACAVPDFAELLLFYSRSSNVSDPET